MNNIDRTARGILSELQKRFPEAQSRPYAVTRNSVVPIGVEIEVPWSAYHPRLWRDFFGNGVVTYEEMPGTQKKELDLLCAEEETELLEKIAKARQAMKTFEGKLYWEYCFPPVCDTWTAVGVCHVLNQAGLIPFNGQHRMQVTIGGIRSCKEAYQALIYLELRYGSKERMLHGICNRGWAIKGRAGICNKRKGDLQFGYKSAVEFRPLVFPGTLGLFAQLLGECALFGGELHRKQNLHETSRPLAAFSSAMSEILEDHGLQDRLWENPGEREEDWHGFAKQFDSMKRRLQPLGKFGFL